jgi:hypothetical protein
MPFLYLPVKTRSNRREVVGGLARARLTAAKAARFNRDMACDDCADLFFIVST